MIFQRALLREFGNLLVGVFAALFAITLTSLLVRILGRAAGGKIPGEAVLAIIGFTALNYLPMLLAIGIFVSVLMALSRSYRDSEMVIWFASGVPLTAWIRPVLLFALPLVVVVGVLSLFLSPWAQEKSETYRRQLEAQSEVSRIAPGVFLESANASQVFFVEAVPGDPESVQNIFVSFKQHGRRGVMVSKRGIIEGAPDGDRFAVLVNGRRYEGEPGSAEYRIMEFDRYAVRIQTREARAGNFEPKMRPTGDLVREPTKANLAELLWRIGLPITALLLPLLAIPLAFVNPRATRSLNLVFAVLTYLVYSNLLTVMQSWVRQGRVSFGVGWWAVHGAMLVLLIGLFYWRMRLHPIPWLRR
ncbi:MAG: LPS export ABC transporter permease LptF [Burkholderiales bacterium]